MMSIECHDLTYAFHREQVLHGLDLTIDPAETVAITGPSGGGKSTLLLCLAGVLTPRSGSVFAGRLALGAATEQTRARWRAENCGFVMQFGDLVDEFTVAENLRIPGLISGRRGKGSASRLMQELGIASLEHRFPSELSGGQRQRVAVARALVGSPAVVFADEPTGALDTANGDRTISLLLEQTGKAGATLIVVTHEQRHLGLFDRVVRLEDGRVVA